MPKAHSRHRYHLLSPGQLPQTPSPILQLVPWGEGTEKSPLGGGEARTPSLPLQTPLPSAASISILAGDLWNNFHNPNLLVSFAARPWFNFNPQ